MRTLICTAVGAILVTGCTNTIAFHERDSTDLSVSLSATPTSPQPVELVLGNKREVYAVVPGEGDNAQSLVATYNTDYVDDGNNGNDFHLDSLFATGAAADILTQDGGSGVSTFLGPQTLSVAEITYRRDVLQPCVASFVSSSTASQVNAAASFLGWSPQAQVSPGRYLNNAYSDRRIAADRIRAAANCRAPS